MTSYTMQIGHTAVTVGTGSTQAAAANADRTYLLVQNDGIEECYIKFGAAAVMAEGIRLEANGGSFEMSPVNGNVDTRVVNAISATGGLNLLVSEA